MSREIDYSMYYDIKRTLTHNCLFNFILGARGSGKTYAFKKWAIEDFIKNGNQFVYVRRYKTELKSVKQYFNDIRNAFPNNKLEVKHREFYIDGECAGYIIDLNNAKVNKSIPYTGVDKICFDEFMLDKGSHRYINDEVTNLLELYSTIARDRDVKIFFLANSISITSPYFTFFKIHPRREKEFTKQGDILIQMVQSPLFSEHMKQTRFGKIINGTQYSAYAVDNEFLRDNNTWVEKSKGKTEQIAVIKWGKKTYGIHINQQTMNIHFNYKYNPNTTRILAYSNEDHEENTILFEKRYYETTLIKERYKYGAIRFDTIAIKNELITLLERLR